jgi:hypothetical protein
MGAPVGIVGQNIYSFEGDQVLGFCVVAKNEPPKQNKIEVFRSSGRAPAQIASEMAIYRK